MRWKSGIISMGGLLALLAMFALLLMQGKTINRPSVQARSGALTSPLSPLDEKATFRIPPGFTIELVASEPQVVDPVAIAFDEEGRMFVAEMPAYPNDGTARGQITSGKIKLLEDRDGDGFYETSTVYAENLRMPTSVMPWKGGALVAVAPDILYFDGPGKSRSLYTGFAIDNNEQLINSLQWGLDNWVYGCAGTGGGTVHSTERDTKAIELRGRGVRFHPESPGSLEPTSGGGQYGLATDDGEHWFTATNNQHLRNIVLPDHYLRRNPYLSVRAVTLDIPDHGAVCKVFRISPFEAWRAERSRRRQNDPSGRQFPATELEGGGYITSACSPVVYTADLFPEAFRNNTFVCEPANNLVHRDILVPQGATFTAQRGDAETEFLASTDTWFRPVSLTVGPDGALYVVDFYREIIETPLSIPDDMKKGLNMGSAGRGRIWRIAPTNSQRRPRPNLHKAPPAQLVKYLADPNPWWRLTAQRLLIERQSKDSIEPLRQLARSVSSDKGRMHALWTLEGLGALDDVLVANALTDVSPLVREQALRLAEGRLKSSAGVQQAIMTLVDDPDPQVRFQLAFSLGAGDSKWAVGPLANLMDRDAEDPWTRTAILSSATESAPALLEKLVHSSDFRRDTSAGKLELAHGLAEVVGGRSKDAEIAEVLGLLGDEEQFLDPWRMAILEGLGTGLRHANRSLGKLMDQPPEALKEPLQRIRPFFDKAVKNAANREWPIDARVAAVHLLTHAPFSIASAKLPEFLAPQASSELQLAAVRALSAQSDPTVAGLLLKPWPGYSPAVRREVLEAIFARPERLTPFLDAVEAKTIVPGQIEPFRREQLRKHPDPAVRARAEKLLAAGADSDRRKVVEDYRSVLPLPARGANGRVVFKRVCAACHQLENEGVVVGPDLLSALRNKSPEALLIDILDPSREVDPRFINFLITSRSGRVYTGMIAVETPSSITLRRAGKEEDVVLRSEIEEIQATNKSLMPEGLESQFSRQELADLIAYLRSMAAPKPAIIGD